jgi:hypothetical protein
MLTHSHKSQPPVTSQSFECDSDHEEVIGVFEAVEAFDSNGGIQDKMDLLIGDVVRVYKIESGWAMAMKVGHCDSTPLFFLALIWP